MNHHNGNGASRTISRQGEGGSKGLGDADLLHRILPLTQAILRLLGLDLSLRRDASGPGFKISKPLPAQGISLIYVRARPELSPFDERLVEPVLHARVFQEAPVSLKPCSATLTANRLSIFVRSDDMKPRRSTAKRETHPIAREYFTDLRSVLVEPHAVAAERLADFIEAIVGHLREG